MCDYEQSSKCNSDFYEYKFKVFFRVKIVEMPSLEQVTGEINPTSIPPADTWKMLWNNRPDAASSGSASQVKHMFNQPLFLMILQFW